MTVCVQVHLLTGTGAVPHVDTPWPDSAGGWWRAELGGATSHVPVVSINASMVSSATK